MHYPHQLISNSWKMDWLLRGTRSF